MNDGIIVRHAEWSTNGKTLTEVVFYIETMRNGVYVFSRSLYNKSSGSEDDA